MERLIGHKIKEINLSRNSFDLEIKTETHKFIYETEGDCCAHAYILPLDEKDVKALLGYEVHKVLRNETSQETEGGYGVIDTEFITIQTHGGDLLLELRTEHNGYYSGRINFVSVEPVWPIFDDIREEAYKGHNG